MNTKSIEKQQAQISLLCLGMVLRSPKYQTRRRGWKNMPWSSEHIAKIPGHPSAFPRHQAAVISSPMPWESAQIDVIP